MRRVQSMNRIKHFCSSQLFVGSGISLHPEQQAEGVMGRGKTRLEPDCIPKCLYGLAVLALMRQHNAGVVDGRRKSRIVGNGLTKCVEGFLKAALFHELDP